MPDTGGTAMTQSLLFSPRLAGCCLVALLSACGGSGPAYEAPARDVAATVEMGGFSFEPATIRINAGETIEWRNKSFFSHTVTDDPPRYASATALPAGAAPFDSGRIASGQIYRHTFAEPGTYKYICTPHADLGMTGTVIVSARQ
jgi:plastocyanin